MVKGTKLFLSCLCLFLLSSCDFIAFDTESLLRPPTLNTQQAQVYAALESTLNSMGIVYKYPQRGDYRSPFIFYDMDGDGHNEAIVLYAYQNDAANTRAQILLQQPDGQWIPSHDFATGCDQVDFVQFAPMLTPDSHCLVIGWASASGQLSQYSERFLSIYSLKDGVFHTEVEQQPYSAYVIHDFDDNHLEEIVLISQDVGRQHTIALLQASGSHIVSTVGLPLSPDATTIQKMTYGKLWDGSQAVYIDSSAVSNLTISLGENEPSIGSISVITEIFRVSSKGLEALVSGSQQEREAQSPAWDNYEYTFRDEADAVFCQDVDGDGIVEVPYPDSMPGVTEDSEDSMLRLTLLMHLTPEGFQVQATSVINRAENYLVYYPDSWEDRVTVVADSEADEWKFYLVDLETGEPTVELLRIQSFSTPGQSSQLDSGFIDLGARGARHYAGYIPRTTEGDYSITEEQLKEMFVLL